MHCAILFVSDKTLSDWDQINQGDCIEGLKSLDDGCIDLVFADPPFNIGYDYDVYQDNLENDEYLNWTRQWMAEVKRVLKENGTFWLAIGDEYAAELKVIMQRELGFTCRSWVIWYYTFGVNCTKRSWIEVRLQDRRCSNILDHLGKFGRPLLQFRSR